MDAFEEQLIESVRQYTALYDTSDSLYMRIKYKHGLWVKIAEQLNKNVEEVKSCWSKLRSQHRDALRRQRRNLRSGAAAQPCKPWKYQKRMQFLLAHMANDSRDTNFAVQGEEEAHPLPQESPIDLESPTQSFHAASMEAVETSSAIEEAHEESMESSAGALALTKIVEKPSAARPKKKKYADPMEEMLREHLEELKQRAKERFSERMTRQEDSLHVFFYSLYLQAKKLPLAYQIEVKRRMMHIVDEYELRLQDNPGPSSTSQFHQLQPMRAPTVPRYHFTGQAEGSFPTPSIPFAIPSAPPSASTADVEEASISSILHDVYTGI